nr:uncharacterized protein LOC117988816 isoform X2 [Maniola hyperantus]
MGLLQSVFCSIVFCVERVLTWTCCAFLLMLMMFTIIILMVYGISVGYHYAQKELASFAMTSRSTTEPTMMRRSGGGNADNRPIVRLVAVNQSEVESAPEPLLGVMQRFTKLKDQANAFTWRHLKPQLSFLKHKDRLENRNCHHMKEN